MKDALTPVRLLRYNSLRIVWVLASQHAFAETDPFLSLRVDTDSHDGGSSALSMKTLTGCFDFIAFS